MLAERPLVFIMGVSGSGKSTIGRMVAEALDVPFHDGDNYHPEENVRKMQAGIPLDDIDRSSWLLRLNALARELITDRGGVIACSALKETYRQLLLTDLPHPVNWILLEGEYDLIKERMLRRAGHYMPASLLDSQFSALEIPAYAIRINIVKSPADLVQQIMSSLAKQQIGVIGLGTMGRGLALNLAEKGFTLALYNRHVTYKEENIAQDLISSNSELGNALGFDDLGTFVDALQLPRRIILMVEAGAADAVLALLMPLLAAGDIVADCGNSHYRDTERRQTHLSTKGIHFLGIGISGGAKGARHGPAIMPGGNYAAYTAFLHALDLVAAKDAEQKPCNAYIGDGGAGHFVKMVHNGIEYAEMQLIAEVYGFLRFAKHMEPDQIAQIFTNWHGDRHRSYLLGITIDILKHREHDSWLIDMIADAARSKGTGNWTLQAAADLGFPSPVIAAAVHARFLSSIDHASQAQNPFDIDNQNEPGNEDIVSIAFYLARLINHHLGFELLRKASDAFGWELDLPEIARIWTNGCIIRSSMMEELKIILPANILLHAQVNSQMRSMRDALSDFVQTSVKNNVYLPCHSAAINFLIGYTTAQPTGNLIQAQRDYFGAHGFQRRDDPMGEYFHIEWE